MGGVFTDPTLDGRYKAGSRFFFVGNLLEIVGSSCGVRAVLWMQGETDSKAYYQTNDPTADAGSKNDWLNRVLLGENSLPRTAPLGDGNNEKRYVANAGEYRNKPKYLINTTRSMLGPSTTLPWIIAKTSFVTNRISSVIIDGQDITALKNVGVTGVYEGPNTDGLGTSSRRDASLLNDEPVHFSDNPLTTVASLWTDKIKVVCNNTEAAPFRTTLGTESQTVQISQDGKTLTAPAGYQYRWVAGNNGAFNIDAFVATSKAVTVNGGGGNATTPVLSAGTYRAVLVNGSGNYILTQTVTLPYNLVNDTPTPPTTTTGIICYEAEAGSRSSGTELSSSGNASGGQYVGGFDGASRYVDFTVNVTPAGNYPLTFYYASGEAGGFIDYRGQQQHRHPTQRHQHYHWLSTALRAM